MPKLNNLLSKISGQPVLAPMSGITDIAFRSLCARYGAAMTSTDLISSTAIVRMGSSSSSKGDKRNSGDSAQNRLRTLLRTASEEKIKVVQLFGSDPIEIAQAAKIIEAQFDIIDINCGCPARKVMDKGAGSALMKSPEKIAKIVDKVSSAVSKPVTIKIRTGLDSKYINAVEVAKLTEKAGVSAITVHGRTVRQEYSGQADWNIIKQVRDAVNIPVIGNGDVFSPEIFKQRLEETDVHAIMIGRAAMGNPCIFSQIKDYMATGRYNKQDNRKLFQEYLKLADTHNVKFASIKAHAIFFTKGLSGAAKIRLALSKCVNIEDISRSMSL